MRWPDPLAAVVGSSHVRYSPVPRSTKPPSLPLRGRAVSCLRYMSDSRDAALHCSTRKSEEFPKLNCNNKRCVCPGRQTAQARTKSSLSENTQEVLGKGVFRALEKLVRTAAKVLNGSRTTAASKPNGDEELPSSPTAWKAARPVGYENTSVVYSEAEYPAPKQRTVRPK